MWSHAFLSIYKYGLSNQIAKSLGLNVANEKQDHHSRANGWIQMGVLHLAECNLCLIEYPTTP